MTFDVLITHGTVVDGTGAPGIQADVGVSGGRITAIAPHLEGSATHQIDATGKIVAPGFIDMHTHSDFTLLSTPSAESKVRQGITTEVVGNCGFSPAPVAPQTLGLLKEYVGFLNPSLAWDWQRLGEFYQRVSDQGCAFNIAPLVGHGAVRIAVMGFDDRPPSAEELRQMQCLVAEAMDDGAFGLSSGLIYTPGCYGDTTELIALAEVARESGGIYATHMRGEGSALETSIAEALRIGEVAHIPVQISHLKASGRENWDKMARALQMVDEGRERGIAVTADIYPYIAGSTTMTSLLPAWALEGGVERLLARLRDSETRKRLGEALSNPDEGWARLNGSLAWEDIVVASCQQQKMFEGRTMAQVATAMGQEPPKALLDFLLAEQGKVSIVVFMMSEANVALGLAHPQVMIGSDSLAMAAGRGGKPHPRTYGTFPRVLGKYVRQDRIISLEDGVRKMTSMAAEKLGLADRGILAEGKAADITIFDASTVQDTATFEAPHQYPNGIDYVIVNGQIVIEHGQQRPVLPGVVLRK